MRRIQCAVAASSAFLAALLSVTPPAGAREFPDDYFFYKADAKSQAGLESLVGQPMPPLQVADWINGKVTPAEMKGKVVVLDIWATWCGPCRAAIPHTNELSQKYAKDGVLVVGVCSSANGQEKLADVVQSDKIAYPVCKDPGSATAKAYSVHFFPTYVVIDRAGKIRAAGLKPNAVEEVVKKVLDEKPAA